MWNCIELVRHNLKSGGRKKVEGTGSRWEMVVTCGSWSVVLRMRMD